MGSKQVPDKPAAAEIIHLWGGEHEHRMRIPGGERFAEPAKVITLPNAVPLIERPARRPRSRQPRPNGTLP